MFILADINDLIAKHSNTQKVETAHTLSPALTYALIFAAVCVGVACLIVAASKLRKPV